MFGRLGMYRFMRDHYQARATRLGDTAVGRLVSKVVPYPGELGMLLRLGGVVAVLLGVAALVISNAG